MKKLIPLLLVIMSVSLHSQEAKYWEKIDFQFDSGIKLIDIYQYSGWYNHSDTTFIIITQNNKLYYFDNLKLSGTIIDGLDSSIIIEKAKLIQTNNSSNIFIITLDNKLMMTSDFGITWKKYGDEIGNSKIKDIAYCGDNGPFIISIATTEGLVYVSEDYGVTWGENNNGINPTESIINLTSDANNIFAISNKNIIYQLMLFKNTIWEKLGEISFENSIKDLRFDSRNIYYFDSLNHLKYVDNYSLPKKVEIPDSIRITCFTVSGWMWLVLGFQEALLPVDYSLVIGTENYGVYFYGNEYYENLTQTSKELYGKFITDIETNSFGNPTICLVGTNDGELYYGGFGSPPNYVENSWGTELLTKISPQPASIKVRLSFTLPMESRVSVKLFNTLGIEQFSIVDGFFLEGENSIPLDVSGLADGMYFVAIQYEGKTVVEKLVVRR